jgi:hypothetical protein
MNDLFKLLIIGILVILKLIITGICLAIGFKVGYMIMDKVEKRNVRPEVAVA